jgi:uncharacterized membrane protein required for colicin V production
MIQFLDALAIFFIISMGALGFKRGLVEELGRLLGLIFATILSLNSYLSLGSFLLNWVKIDVWLLFILSFISIFSIILILVRVITKLIHYLFLSKSTNWVNRIMGIIFGTIKGILFVMIFFWLFELMPNQRTKDIVSQKSKISNRLVNLRKTIVLTFNLKDPIEKGEKRILEYLESMGKISG